MKIADELLILTREHHVSLSLANKCINTAKSNNTSNIKDLCVQVSKTFRQSFSEHFEIEELIVFTPIKNKSDLLLKLYNQLIDEHQRLYKLAEDLPNHPEYLLSFGSLLKSHSRLEDRQLFPKIDLLSDSEKLAIIKLSLCHTPMVKTNYQFWQNNIELEPQVKVIGEDIMIENNIDLQAIEAKLTKARTQLILDKPFLGNLVLRLPLKAAGSWCRSSATDAKSFYYNPSFIDQLDNHQVKFVLIHEALHCALTHFSRCGNRLKHKWDLACDFAINPLLVKEGFHPPLDLPIFHKYKGMIAEEIYPMIDDSIDTEPMDQHLYDDNPKDDVDESDWGLRKDDLQNNSTKDNDKNNHQNNTNSSGLADKPNPLTPDEIQQLSRKWQKNLASSAELAQQAGKLDGEFVKLIDFFLQPQFSWQSLLSQYMFSFARDDFSYARPSRRSGNAILPSLRSSQIDITVAIDTSGSISEDEINEFVAEINAIKSNIRASITLIACDEKISKELIWRFEAWEELTFPVSLGGGKGTNFNPVFDYVSVQDNTASSVLIYFTDAKGKFPEFEPSYPVMWFVKGKENVPWGHRIQLN